MCTVMRWGSNEGREMRQERAWASVPKASPRTKWWLSEVRAYGWWGVGKAEPGPEGFFFFRPSIN